MSYQINLTNGNVLGSGIPDAQLVTSYGGLSLIGKKYPGFGTSLNTDLVHITENFANSIPPLNPFVGQLWYDTVTSTLNFWNGTNFVNISIVTSSATSPLNPQEGDEWFNTTTGQLFIWNGTQWSLIGPPGISGGGLEGLIPVKILINGVDVYYLQLYANGILIGIIASQNIIQHELDGFGNIRAGLNFVTYPDIGITSSGIYNIDELTIGNNDQIHTTLDSNNNMILALNEYTVGGNVLIGSTNTGTPSEVSSLTGNIYVNNLIADNIYGNISGNLNVSGGDGDVLFNNHGTISASTNLTLSSDRSNVNINNTLFVSNIVANSEIINGTLTVNGNGNISNNLTIDGNANVNGTVIFNSGSSNAFVLPNNKGSNGNVLISNGDSTTVWGTPSIGWSKGNNGNGYWEIYPTGRIHQWGSISTSWSSGDGFFFPIPFTDVSSVQVLATDTKNPTGLPLSVNNFTIYGFQAYNGGGDSFGWMADGY